MSEVVAENTQARFHYQVVDTYEVGLVLKGCEVKSLRMARLTLQEAWILVQDGELWIRNFTIQPYPQASFDPPDPLRMRKLLAHRREIARLEETLSNASMTLIPLKLYFVNRRAKLLIAIARGKTHRDQREAIKEREDKRRIARALKNHG